MFDYGLFRFEDKQDLFDKAIRFWNPDKTQFWQNIGVDLVIDRREGYCLYDMSGRRLIDLHLNGGTYNFGHRHPELVETLKGALDYFDMGNHWFPSVARAALSEALIKTAPDLKYAVFGAGGAEGVEIALKSARYATKRRKIVSIVKGYHGHSGLSVATGDERFTKIFLADRPDEFVQVPFNDIDAMEQALKGNDVAALIMETIPATYGFPMPKEGYLQACKRALRPARRGLHRRRGADRPDAHRRDVGLAGLRHPAGHHGDRQGAGRRALPDQRRGGGRALRRLAERGRRGAHLHLGRGRARLHRRPQGARDAAPAGGPSRTRTS